MSKKELRAMILDETKNKSLAKTQSSTNCIDNSAIPFIR